MHEFRIAVLPGDGIGREVMAPCLALLDIAVARAGGFRLAFDVHDAGAELYRRTGVAMPDTALARGRVGGCDSARRDGAAQRPLPGRHGSAASSRSS